MSLEKWAEYGWLKAEASSPDEIRDLLGIVARALKDSKVEAISEDLRFQAAFSAALTSANIALPAASFKSLYPKGHFSRPASHNGRSRYNSTTYGEESYPYR
jgi:hypothetical protein